MLFTTIIFLIVLAVLIFVHELGHFLAARASGIRVDAFALGFGPKLLSWKKGETVYSLNAIPFGGYVKIHGENPNEESISGPDSKRSFVNKPRWKQVVVLIAGVSFNFIFAGILYVIVFSTGFTTTTDSFPKYSDRITNERVMITDLSADSPADKAGLKIGDNILSVRLSSDNTPPVSQKLTALPVRIEDIQNLINTSNGEPIEIRLNSSEEPTVVKTYEVSPTTGLVKDKYAIGIAMQNVGDLKLPFISSIYEGSRYTITMIKGTAVGLSTFFSSIFKGTAKFSDVSGPVGIAGIVGSAAGLGFNYLLMITALISINLGVINLVPFPALDGGRVLFVLIEGAIRRRIPIGFTNGINLFGFALLMLLMVVITYKDIIKLVK